MTSDGEMVAVGRNVRPHGVRGLVKVRLFCEESRSLLDTQEVVVENGDSGISGSGGPRSYRIVEARKVGDGVLLGLEGVDDRDAAENLRGATVLIAREALPPVDEGEFYYHDLPGIEVVDETGARVGVVTSAFETAASDIIVVETSERNEVLVPMVDEIVLSLDTAAKKMVVKRVPGLFGTDRGPDDGVEDN